MSTDGFPATFAIQTTPDGVSIVAMRQGLVTLFPVAGGEPRSVPGTVAGDVPLRVSADGRSLFVFDTVREIFKVDLLRGTRQPWRQIVHEGGGPAAFLPAVVISPDGNSYAYLLRDDTSTLYVATGLH